MTAPAKKFGILITTKNRVADLSYTLGKIQQLFRRDDVELVVTDDGSTDGTFEFLKSNYPEAILHRNPVSLGYLRCRNEMLNNSRALYTITLDDDAHFLSENPLEEVAAHFESHPECGLIAFRIFWSRNPPGRVSSDEKSQRVRGFVGCGHAWRMDSWRRIPDYPEWFKFYGEESYASIQLFMHGIEVHYLPQVLVQHCVDLKLRKQNSDYRLRYKNSLRADYFLFFLFNPIQTIPRRLGYSVYAQLRSRIFKTEPGMLWPLLGALWQVGINLPKLLRERTALTMEQYDSYLKLEGTKIYWKP